MSAVRISESEDIHDSVNEKSGKADPWELPEFTNTTIPWRGIEQFYF